jgi:hypothetical protein
MLTQAAKHNPAAVPVALSLSQMTVSIAALISNPIAGAIVDQHGSWLGVQLYSGLTQLVGIVILSYGRFKGGGLKWAVY